MNIAYVIGVVVLLLSGLYFFVSLPSDDEGLLISDQEPDYTLPGVTERDTPPPVGSTVEVYDGIYVPKNIVVLDLSGRGLSGSLKAEIRQLTELRELNISNNRFTGLPAEVGQLSQLELLNLSGNPLTGLPYEIGNLQNLIELDLTGTDFSAQDLAVIAPKLPETTSILVDEDTQ